MEQRTPLITYICGVLERRRPNAIVSQLLQPHPKRVVTFRACRDLGLGPYKRSHRAMVPRKGPPPPLSNVRDSMTEVDSHSCSLECEIPKYPGLQPCEITENPSTAVTSAAQSSGTVASISSSGTGPSGCTTSPAGGGLRLVSRRSIYLVWLDDVQRSLDV